MLSPRGFNTFSMAISFQRLYPILKQFERHHFSALTTTLINRASTATPYSAANGGIQFVSIEPGKNTCRATNASHAEEFWVDDDRELPLIVGIGINYGQGPQCTSFPSFQPWMPSIIDFAPEMRRAADGAMAAYRRNAVEWTSSATKTGPRASHVPHLSAGDDYILVATNFCPFITLKQWGRHSSSQSKALLSAWPSALHLDALYKLIGGDVDLWMAHGINHWKEFDLWRARLSISNWMKTYNLSGLGSANMAKAKLKNHPLYR
ncbi:MAG: hypothetical protein JWL59_4805 [Chthoniobacteraceae bacterium]|nr:hypothetical protein [Chthoniobacteraceae bacterium]